MKEISNKINFRPHHPECHVKYPSSYQQIVEQGKYVPVKTSTSPAATSSPAAASIGRKESQISFGSLFPLPHLGSPEQLTAPDSEPQSIIDPHHAPANLSPELLQLVSNPEFRKLFKEFYVRNPHLEDTENPRAVAGTSLIHHFAPEASSGSVEPAVTKIPHGLAHQPAVTKTPNEVPLGPKAENSVQKNGHIEPSIVFGSYAPSRKLGPLEKTTSAGISEAALGGLQSELPSSDLPSPVNPTFIMGNGASEDSLSEMPSAVNPRSNLGNGASADKNPQLLLQVEPILTNHGKISPHLGQPISSHLGLIPSQLMSPPPLILSPPVYFTFPPFWAYRLLVVQSEWSTKAAGRFSLKYLGER
ncbi:multidrug resistance protein MdtC [Striga asiatica]|uniref:Multidrug resistance protein MdtC n=1 Tax=Striga asiatica TaxID=4170 RepID=A0A5A7PF86_STRAF|nr:multidrug resistance protein MdtC [Striga asiatica]